MPERVTFAECVSACLAHDDYVNEWLRLRGFSLPRSVIARHIDEVTGYSATIAAQFLEDVYELVWRRIPPECRG